MRVTFYEGMANFIGGGDGLSFLSLFYHGVFLFSFFFSLIFSMILSVNKEFGFLSPKVGVSYWVVY